MDLVLLDWTNVNHYMRDDYRLLVSAIAARQLPNAAPELQTMARNAFTSIPVKGARSFFKGDLVQQRQALAKAMQKQDGIAPIVIALWAQGAAPQINLLKQSGETAGITFNPEWDWRNGIQGFYDFEDIKFLAALADGLGEHTSEQEADNLKLAALWLGPAITNLETLPVPEETDDESEEHEHEHFEGTDIRTNTLIPARSRNTSTSRCRRLQRKKRRHVQAHAALMRAAPFCSIRIAKLAVLCIMRPAIICIRFCRVFALQIRTSF